MASNRSKLLTAIIGVIFIISIATVYLTLPADKSFRELKVATLRGACGISFTEVIDALEMDKKVGGDVTMVPLDGVPIEVEALLRGEVDLAIVPVEFLPEYVGKGNDLRMLLLDMTQYQALVSKPSISSIRSLDGKTIGVAKPTSTFLTLRAYLLEGGFKITEEKPSAGQVAVVNIPIPAMQGALEKGEVDAIATIGTSTILSTEKAGTVLSTFSDWSKSLGLNGPPPLIMFVTTASKLKEKGSDIDALLRSRGDALQEWLKTGGSVVDKLYVEKCGLKKDLASKYHEWIVKYVWKGEPLGDDVKKGVRDHIALLAKHKVIDTGGLSVEEVVGRLLAR
ncbi:MAG: ABC transporter substrate-binding protein [Thaumarchaeota archaeon]|nr:ABC transporter substrate-binding protein [Nitrososphaerota archaeon]